MAGIELRTRRKRSARGRAGLPPDDGRPGWPHLGRRLNFLANPAWERAPMLLRRFPGLLAAVVGAGFVLAVASASEPLFVSSASNAALHANLRGLCPWSVGLEISALQPLSGPGVFTSPPTTRTPSDRRVPPIELFRQRDDSLEAAVGGIDHLGQRELTAIGTAAVASSDRSSTTPLVRLMSRDGFRSNIQVLSAAGGDGVWVPDVTARFLKVRAGDSIRLTLGTPVGARVAGIYRSLSSQPPSTFWCSQKTAIFGVDPNSAPPRARPRRPVHDVRAVGADEGVERDVLLGVSTPGARPDVRAG